MSYALIMSLLSASESPPPHPPHPIICAQTKHSSRVIRNVILVKTIVILVAWVRQCFATQVAHYWH